MDREKFVNMIEFDEGGRIVNFNVPIQVRFLDEEFGFYRIGIGYNDFVICCCCGGVIPLDEIYEYAIDRVGIDESIIPFEEWESFSDIML